MENTMTLVQKQKLELYKNKIQQISVASERVERLQSAITRLEQIPDERFDISWSGKYNVLADLPDDLKTKMRTEFAQKFKQATYEIITDNLNKAISEIDLIFGE